MSRRASRQTDRLRAMEQDAVILSLRHLMTFPYVAEAVEKGELSLHGLWTDISDGTLEYYDAKEDKFAIVG